MYSNGDDTPRLHPATGVGLVFFLGGLGLWVWEGDWKWAATGLIACMAFLIVTVVMNGIDDDEG